jgi:hypothetical protein
MLLPKHTWEGIAAGPIVIAVRRGVTTLAAPRSLKRSIDDAFDARRSRRRRDPFPGQGLGGARGRPCRDAVGVDDGEPIWFGDPSGA